MQRAAPVDAPNVDSIFALVSSMDAYGCGKQLICELEAKAQLAQDEAVLLRLFRYLTRIIRTRTIRAQIEISRPNSKCLNT